MIDIGMNSTECCQKRHFPGKYYERLRKILYHGKFLVSWKFNLLTIMTFALSQCIHWGCWDLTN